MSNIFDKCPFCGETPFALDINQYRCQIFCHCGASVRHVYGKNADLDENLRTAISIWNKREKSDSRKSFPGSKIKFSACPMCGGTKFTTSSESDDLRIRCNCGLSLRIESEDVHGKDHLAVIAERWNSRTSITIDFQRDDMDG